MMTELLAVIAIVLGACKLATLLGMQLLGDFREAARQASIKRLHAQKRRYKPTVSAVVYTDGLTMPMDEVLDALRESDYTLKEVLVIANPKSDAAKQTNHYRRVNKLAKLISVRHYAIDNKFKILGKKPKGQLLLLLDGVSIPVTGTTGAGIMPFRDKTVATVLPFVSPIMTESMASGLRAGRHIVSLHFQRALKPRSTDVYGALFMRTTVFMRIIKKHDNNTSFIDIAAVASELGDQSRLVRQADAVVRAESVRMFPIVSVGTFLWWAVDIMALWGVMYYFGRYEGVAVIVFALIFMWVLAAIAILVAKGMRNIDKANLLLLAPFTYVVTQLGAPVHWAVAYTTSYKK